MLPAEQQMQFVFTLRSRGVTNAEVLKAMEQTPRREFLEGIFQERAFTESVPFVLKLKMRRNPNMVENGRFPTAIEDFKYEPAR